MISELNRIHTAYQAITIHILWHGIIRSRRIPYHQPIALYKILLSDTPDQIDIETIIAIPGGADKDFITANRIAIYTFASALAYGHK